MTAIQRVDFDSLESLALVLGSSSRAIGRELDELEATADGLRSQWTGEAADAYETARASWRAQLVELADFLQQIGTATSASAKALQAVETGFADQF